MSKAVIVLLVIAVVFSAIPLLHAVFPTDVMPVEYWTDFKGTALPSYHAAHWHIHHWAHLMVLKVKQVYYILFLLLLDIWMMQDQEYRMGAYHVDYKKVNDKWQDTLNGDRRNGGRIKPVEAKWKTNTTVLS